MEVDARMEEQGAGVTQEGQRELRFWSTDVLRLAHANIRAFASSQRSSLGAFALGRGRVSQGPAKCLRVHLSSEYVAPAVARAHHLLPVVPAIDQPRTQGFQRFKKSGREIVENAEAETARKRLLVPIKRF